MTEKATPSEQTRRGKPTAFLTHPVSPTLKRDVMAKGYVIVDAQSAPEDYEVPAEVQKLVDADASAAVASKPKAKKGAK